MPNQEQVKSAIRWAMATFGPFLTANGYASDSMIQLGGGILISLVPFVWGLFAHTQENAVAVVGEIAKDPTSPVKGVVVENNMAGRKLAESIPGPTVVPAGTPAAEKIAQC